MEGLIRETNENLKSIINTMKENLDSATNVLENIQSQMDKKVEEAKKYKIEVDTAKEKIKEIEEDNRNLEISLDELNEKYGKLNLVSLIETGNKEIKAKINENIKEINKNKAQIAELTNKAKTIKELLINLKKDKTIKEEKLDSLRTVYEFYSKNLNEIIEYSYENVDNLDSFKSFAQEETKKINTYSDLENNYVFDEIADIDDNNDNDYNVFEDKDIEEQEESDINLEDLESTQVFDSIIYPEYEIEKEEDISEKADEFTEEIMDEDKEIEEKVLDKIVENENEPINLVEETEETDESEFKVFENNFEEIEENNLEETTKFTEPIEEITSTENTESINDTQSIPFDFNIMPENNILNTSLNELSKFKDINVDINDDNTELDFTTNNRINEISDFLTDIENTKTENIELDNKELNKEELNNIEQKIENVLKIDNIEEDSTLTDIFGNPISSEEINKTISQSKNIEELFIENGIDFNKFKEDEQNYLKQIYDEDKFINIFNVLNKHKINTDNLYNSFNIFGEINPLELDNIITKLINVGQSVETIGLILEKMPKIKKYNLDEAIKSFNDEIENINITELILRAKELYNGGNK